jgi:IS5 family transposase
VPTPDYDPEIEAAALGEIDRLTAEFRDAIAETDRRRTALHEAIIRHLMERNARPGDIAEHSPYDRNHVRRLGVEAGVPPLREPKPTTRRPRKKAS